MKIHTIRIFIIVFLLMLGTLAQAQEAPSQNQKNIKALIGLIRKKFLPYHQEIMKWRADTNTVQPELPVDLRRAYYHLARLYRKENEPGKALWYERTLEFYEVENLPKKKEQIEEDSWFVSAGALQRRTKLNLETAALNSELATNFRGISVGIGKYFAQKFMFHNELFLANADIDSGGIEQEAAVLIGNTTSLNYKLIRSEKLNLYAGAAVTILTLKTAGSDVISLKDTLEPSAILNGQLKLSYSLNANISAGMSQNGASFGAALIYKF